MNKNFRNRFFISLMIIFWIVVGIFLYPYDFSFFKSDSEIIKLNRRVVVKPEIFVEPELTEPIEELFQEPVKIEERKPELVYVPYTPKLSEYNSMIVTFDENDTTKIPYQKWSSYLKYQPKKDPFVEEIAIGIVALFTALYLIK